MADFVFWASVATLCVLLYFWLRRNSKSPTEYWSSRGFATFDTTELLGSFFMGILFPKPLRQIDDVLYHKVKHDLRVPYVGVNLFGMPQVIVTDLDLAKRVFVKDSEAFLARLQISAMKDTDPMFASMLFFMEGEPWRELRSKMSPTFTTGKIKKMFHVFESSSAKLVDFLITETGKPSKRHSKEVELLDAYGRYTMDVIASAAFGIDAKTFAEDEPIFTRMAKKLQFDPTFKIMLVFLLMTMAPKIASALKIGMIDKEMEAFFTKVIKNAIKHRETTGDRRDDFLQLMLDARNGQLKDDEEDKENANGDLGVSTNATKPPAVVLTDHVLTSQSLLFILAGFDTTQTLLVFAIYELALNPEIQERLREELDESFNNNGGKFTYETVNQLDYLDKVINESLRKYPPVTRLERRTMHDYPIPDTNQIIPKGSQVIIQTFCIHRDEDYFPDPDRFDPERFSPENKNARHPYAFQPFGHGPRNCIGMRFALTNAKMVIATLVHNFKFEPTEKTLIPMQFENTNFLKPKGGMHLKVTKREA